ncbi:hypothetical protein TELCIR_08159, partial [Teladorsagia circumcincta]
MKTIEPDECNRQQNQPIDATNPMAAAPTALVSVTVPPRLPDSTPVPPGPANIGESVPPGPPPKNVVAKKVRGDAENRRREKMLKREKLAENTIIQSDNFTWRVIKLLGSGGFGDVYKVVKENNEDKKIYAMKTEMVEGDKRNLRLKIEVHVLTLCLNIEEPARKEHFVELIDRGKKEKFKFLVMTLVGATIDDIRRNVLGRNYSKSTGMQLAYQTLQSLSDLHNIGYLH